jgi:arginine decarboxylase
MPLTQADDRGRMQIDVAAGAGRGPTELAAFDAALRTVGVSDYNLIRLSSVIPPRSVVSVPRQPLSPPGGWGDRLYVVVAESRTGIVGDQAWAGIGWIQDPHGGHGLFVEHEGHSEAKVRSDIELSLAALRQSRGTIGAALGQPQIVTSGVTCTDQAVCALVLAVFAAESWHSGKA